MKKITSIIILLLVFNTTVFAKTANINITGENKYKSLRLTPEIYNNANSDLSDILIKDNKGEQVPYFINSGNLETNDASKSYDMSLINSYVKDNLFYFDYGLTMQTQSDIISSKIEFYTNSTNFAKNVSIFGSYDNINWEFIKDDKIYNVDNNTKVYIAFDNPVKYTFYRLQLSNNQEQIELDGATLSHNEEILSENYFIESITPEFKVSEENKITTIEVKGLKNLCLSDVTIITDSTFKRNANIYSVVSKEIYNLNFNDTLYSDTKIQLNKHVLRDEFLIININNNDDKPIDVKGVNVKYYADEIVFEALKDKTYTLHFGADETKNAPIYDLVNYKNKILDTTIDNVTMSLVVEQKEKEEEISKFDFKLIINVVVVIITIILGLIILTNLKNKN